MIPFSRAGVSIALASVLNGLFSGLFSLYFAILKCLENRKNTGLFRLGMVHNYFFSYGFFLVYEEKVYRLQMANMPFPYKWMMTGMSSVM
jgi:hypothetical protein